MFEKYSKHQTWKCLTMVTAMNFWAALAIAELPSGEPGSGRSRCYASGQGLAKPHSSRLAWYHLGLQRSDLASVNRPSYRTQH